jgi:hypothetical protein
VRTEVAELTRRLMETAPRGSGLPLFRNTQGNAWKKVTGVVRFQGIKKTLCWAPHPVRKKFRPTSPAIPSRTGCSRGNGTVAWDARLKRSPS